MQDSFLQQQSLKYPLLPCTLPITSSSWVELVMIVLLCELIFTSVGVQTTQHISQETSNWTQAWALTGECPDVYFTELPLWTPTACNKDMQTPPASAVLRAHEPGMLASSLRNRTPVFWSQSEAWFPWSKWKEDIFDRLLVEKRSRLNSYIL